MTSKKTDKLAKMIAEKEVEKTGQPTSNNGQDQKVTEFYMEVLRRHQNELGKSKLTVWMQVGSFFEVYGLKYPDGKTEGTVWDVADDLNIKVARKAMLVYGNPDIEVYMAGVKEEYADPYLERLVDAHGWTVAVYNQEKINGGSECERYLKNIISPGINFESDSISNVFMYIYMKGTNSRMNPGEVALHIGVYFVDCISGMNGCMELHCKSINDYNVIFSELVKLITIKNPSELVVHLDIPNLANYRQFTESEIYTSLTLFDKTVKFVKQAVEAKLTVPTYQEQVIEKAYFTHRGKQSILEILGIDGQYEYGRMAMCLALSYILQHDSNIIKQLEKPEIMQSSTEYLMLANNCLQQLDIIDINTRTRISNLSRESELIENRVVGGNEFGSGSSNGCKKLTLLELLDKTKSVIGRRLFRQRLSIPITNPAELNRRYDQIDTFRQIQSNYTAGKQHDWALSPINEIRTILGNIKDVPKYMRKMATDKMVPADLDIFIHSLKYIQNLWTYIYDQLNGTGATSALTSIPDLELKSLLDTLVSDLEAAFNLSVCNNHWNNIELNIWNAGYCPEADKLNTEIIADLNFYEQLKSALSKIIIQHLAEEQTTKQQSATSKKTKSAKAPTKNLADATYISEDANTKLGKYLWVNDTNHKILSNIDKSTIIHIGQYSIPFGDIEFFNLKKGRWQIRTQYLYLSSRNLSDNIDTLRKLLRKKFSEWQLDFFTRNHLLMCKYADFVGEVDVVQSCVYVADRYAYCRPEISNSSGSDNRAFLNVTAIRHPIVERIRNNTQYVTNNLQFGIPGQDGVLLFGINSSGKSTTMKAIGCCMIMAQAGMYVPATKFEYSPYKYLFTRIRNNDDIYAGLSSFEVEMKEFKVILKYSDENSMILGDELCSGTETLDATALVASGLQQLCKRRANFLFATHLHFLSELPMVTQIPNLKFYHLAVSADPTVPDRLIYDRKLQPGNGPQSYGILVCKSMKLDTEFVREAERIRRAIESGEIMANVPITAAKTGNASKYNSQKQFGACEVCGSADGSDIHHINQQCSADNRGIIQDDSAATYHKNSKWNLVCLCKNCHQAIHAKPAELVINGYIQTSTGIELKWSKSTVSVINAADNTTTPSTTIQSPAANIEVEAIIMELYKDGKSYRAIQYTLRETYGIKMSLDMIKKKTATAKATTS